MKHAKLMYELVWIGKKESIKGLFESENFKPISCSWLTKTSGIHCSVEPEGLYFEEVQNGGIISCLYVSKDGITDTCRFVKEKIKLIRKISFNGESYHQLDNNSKAHTNGYLNTWGGNPSELLSFIDFCRENKADLSEDFLTQNAVSIALKILKMKL